MLQAYVALSNIVFLLIAFQESKVASVGPLVPFARNFAYRT